MTRRYELEPGDRAYSAMAGAEGVVLSNNGSTAVIAWDGMGPTRISTSLLRPVPDPRSSKVTA